MGSREVLRDLPSIDRLLAVSGWDALPTLPHSVRVEACRVVVARAREAVLSAANQAGGQDLAAQSVNTEVLAAEAIAEARLAVRPRIRRVINATGVVLHTNLGRSPLSTSAIAAITRVAGTYSNLEMNLETGARDSRHARLGASLARVLGCGDALVTNNNAAAVFLALSALAGDGAAVAVSRGELVEIGGSFRMPDIMRTSGAQLVEVGTTNRTRIDDYASALADGASLVVKVHRSNFEMVGFTEEVGIAALASLCREQDAVLLHDLGSGLLEASPQLREDSVTASLEAGADLVLFSGDKLLGGPQAGVVAGRADIVERLRVHPVMRLVRPGKLTLLALEATLLAWERDPCGGEIPASVLIQRTEQQLQQDAEELLEKVAALEVARAWQLEIVSVESTPGGGSSAAIRLPSRALSLCPRDGDEESLAGNLRAADPPIVGRIEGGRVLLDLRTLLPGDLDAIVESLAAMPLTTA